MLFAAIWNAMMRGHPGAFSRGFSVWESGQRAVDVLGRNAPQCLVSALVSSVMPPSYAVEASAGKSAAAVANSDLVNVAMTGAIALEMVNYLLLERAKGRRGAVEEAEVLERGRAGVSRGHGELAHVLGEQVHATEALQTILTQMEKNAPSSET